MFSNFLKKFNKIIKFFLLLTGCLTILVSTIILFYGDTSHSRRNIIFDNFHSMLGIGKKYDAFIANTPKKFIQAYYLGVINNFKNHKIPELEIIVNFKNLKILEAQRKKDTTSNLPVYAKAKIKLTNDKITEFFKVKIRAKGDRTMHRIDIDQMSYKIDVRKNKYIFGMEEMSIQKAIIRNYGWELLFQEVAKKEGLINLKIIPIKLLRNSEKLGIFVIEEGFSKELLEKQGRKDGPIIGIEETLNHNFPYLTYDFYSEKKWSLEYPDIYLASKNNLEVFKKNYSKGDFKISDYFDIELWAKYFAIIDVLKAYHAAVPKSVKLYFNSSTGLFEPIAFDAQISSGYDDFMFLDFYKNDQINCGFVCIDKNWLKVFFNKKNPEFMEFYIKYLEEYVSDNYLNSIKNIITKKIEPFNEIIYSEFPNSNRVFFKGFLPYYFDPKPIFDRANHIKTKIESVKHEILAKKKFDNLNFIQNKIRNKKFKTISNLGDINKLDKIVFSNDLWLLKDLIINDKDIFLEKGAVLILKGDNYFQGFEGQMKIKGNGMIVQQGGSLIIENVEFKNLENIKINGYNWSGSINAIESTVKIKNVDVSSSKGEDAINIVNSKSYIEDLRIHNSESDALDIDFGNLFFTKIYCYHVLNDCLDTSGASIVGDYLHGVKIGDKLASFGEKSIAKINTVKGNNIKIGVASKDESRVEIKNLDIENTKIYGASYIKKFFFNEAFLNINSLDNYNNEKKLEDIFVNTAKNILIVNKKNIEVNTTSINNLELLN